MGALSEQPGSLSPLGSLDLAGPSTPQATPPPKHSPRMPARVEQPDPELAAMPGPARRHKAVTVIALALGAAAAFVMVFALRREIMYALVVGAPGAAEAAADLGVLRSTPDVWLIANENRPVRASGLLGATGGIRYERPFIGDTFRTLPVVGRSAAFDLWVEVRVPQGQESGRWEPPRTFAGRLLRLDAPGPRHRGLRDAIEQATHEHVPSGAWLIVDGEQPADARWAIVVGAMFLVFAGWNAAAIGRIVRRLRG